MNTFILYRSIRRGLVTAFGAAAVTTTASATTWFVSTCGQDFWTGVDVNCIAPNGPKRFIQTAINIATDGDTIMVMPGTYFETIDLQGKAITLIGAGGPDVTTINGNHSGPVVRLDSSEGPDTVIQGLTITSGSTTVNGGGMLIAAASPTIVNCTLLNNSTTGNGAGVACYWASPTFTDCIIAFNHAGAEPPTPAAGMGGGIYAISSNITMNDTFMQTCYATGRGALMALIDSVATISDCEFYTSGTTFTHGDGGGIFLNGSTATINGCLFDGVNAWSPDSEGGSILATNGSEVTCTATTFQDASAEVRGGAASILNSTASFIGCEFNTLIAYNGGALYVADGSLNLTLCGMHNNGATAITGNGGAIRAYNSVVTLGLTTFTNNSCTWIGGAVYAYGGEMSMQGCTFSGNEGRLRGGAVGTVDCALTADSCSFTGNEVAHQTDTATGGALDITSAVNAQLSFVNNCTFEDNTADVGGGLYASWTHLAVDGCTFENNTADWNAGAMQLYTQWQSSEMSVRNSQFIGNSASNLAGAMQVGGIGEAFIHGCTFTGNQASTAGAVNCSQSRTWISSSRFNNNVATDRGAAAQVSLDGRLNMVNCVVHNNTAPFGGGAIADSYSEFWHAALRLLNCTVANNNGGGIALENESINAVVANAIVWGNSNGGQFLGVLPTVRRSNVQGGVKGEGNMNVNPLFQGALGGNYRLNPASPCIDAGHNWALPVDVMDVNANADSTELWPVDFDGNPRITDDPAVANTGCSAFAAVVDIGAFESVGILPGVPVNPADLNGDGIVGVPDLLLLINAWGPCNDACCIADINFDGTIGVPDLLLIINNWG